MKQRVAHHHDNGDLCQSVGGGRGLLSMSDSSAIIAAVCMVCQVSSDGTGRIADGVRGHTETMSGDFSAPGSALLIF
jgi:hypothetical protein